MNWRGAKNEALWATVGVVRVSLVNVRFLVLGFQSSRFLGSGAPGFQGSRVLGFQGSRVPVF